MYYTHRCCCLVTKSCLALCDPIDCSQPDSSVHGLLQARILEWVAISFSRGSSRPRDQTWVSCTAGRFFTVWVTREYLTLSKLLCWSPFLGPELRGRHLHLCSLEEEECVGKRRGRIHSIVIGFSKCPLLKPTVPDLFRSLISLLEEVIERKWLLLDSWAGSG